MKEKILPFIIGLLLGAILATGGFLIYSKSVGGNNQNMPQMNDGMGNPPDKPSGKMGEPRELPKGDNGSEPPEKPSETPQNSN